MSQTTTPPPVASQPTLASRVNEWGVVTVSLSVLLVFMGAVVVAWITKSSSLDTLLGIAGTNATIAVGFWLGSSNGSQKKDAALAAAAATPPTTTGGTP